MRTEVSFSSWEGKANRKYGFNLRTLQDGRVVEDLRGEALMGEGESGGTANFTRPDQKRLDLPPGTLFPVAHTRLLIEEAEAGRDQVIRPVFLGQREDEPMSVNALISARGDDKPGERNELLKRPSWKFHLSFFGPDDDLLPSFEIHERLYDNGIVGDAIVVYDEFSFAYTLEGVEALPIPKC